jgi:hypothetical protein
MSQGDVVSHSGNHKESGPLVFTQSTLQCKLKNCPQMESQVHSHPNALLSKKVCIVIRPDVERAFHLWFKHMEEKGEAVNSAMLMLKQEQSEISLDVPDDECLTGGGWFKSFFQSYGIKNHCRHGETGSVDQAAVEQENVHIAAILKHSHPKDQFNFDETGLFSL